MAAVVLAWHCFLCITCIGLQLAEGMNHFGGAAPPHPPKRLRTPMEKTPRIHIYNAAPPDPYPRVKEALTLPLLSLGENATNNLIEDVVEGLQYVLQTKNRWTFPIHGTGTTGAHAVFDNMIETGEKILVLINGYWSEVMAQMAERLGAQVVRFAKPLGTAFTLSEISTALQTHRPRLVALVNGESSTTVYQPLDGIGKLCHKHGALLIVDVVATVGIQPILMDKRDIDVVYFSSSKGLGGVGGLAGVSLSEKAVEKVARRQLPPRAYQTDFALQAQLWNSSNPGRTIFQSMSIPLLRAFREALATIVEEGLENTFERHARATNQLGNGLTALGLKYYVADPTLRLVGLPGFNVPTRKSVTKIAEFLLQKYSIAISTGFGPTTGQILRLALFGPNADPLKVQHIITAVNHALNSPETNI